MKVKELRELLRNMNDESEVVVKEYNGSIRNAKSVEEVHERRDYDFGETFGWYTNHRCIIEAGEY